MPINPKFEIERFIKSNVLKTFESNIDNSVK